MNYIYVNETVPLIHQYLLTVTLCQLSSGPQGTWQTTPSSPVPVMGNHTSRLNLPLADTQFLRPQAPGNTHQALWFSWSIPHPNMASGVGKRPCGRLGTQHTDLLPKQFLISNLGLLELSFPEFPSLCGSGLELVTRQNWYKTQKVEVKWKPSFLGPEDSLAAHGGSLLVCGLPNCQGVRPTCAAPPVPWDQQACCSKAEGTPFSCSELNLGSQAHRTG